MKIRNRFSSYLYSAVILSGYVFFFALAYWIAFAFRFDFDHKSFAMCYSSMAWVVLLKTAIFFWHKHFSNYCFYASFKDFLVLIKSSLISAVGIFVLAHYFFDLRLPRTVPVLDCLFTICLIGTVRFGWRTLRQELIPRITKYPYRKTVIVGANYQGASLAHELYSHPKLGYRILGFISIHKRKIGQLIGHVPILGHIDDLETLLVRHGVQEVLTFSEVLNGKEMREVMTICQDRKIHIRIVPSMENRLGNDSVPMRDIKIEDQPFEGALRVSIQLAKWVSPWKTREIGNLGGKTAINPAATQGIFETNSRSSKSS